MSTLPDIQLDPRSEYELWEQAANHAFNVSNGTIRNFSPGDPLAFLLEGQVYAGAELLWYVNQLPTKLIATWLAAWGVETTEGSRSTGLLTISFTAALPTGITIPAGFQVSGNGQLFGTLLPANATAGMTEITVQIEAIDIGVAGNLPAFSVNQVVSPIAFVRSVFNAAQLSGGSDEVSPQDAIDSFVGKARDNLVVSRQDILDASSRYLGAGWVVRSLLNLNPTTGLTEQGTLAILIDNPAYQVVPIGLLAGLQSYLDSVCPVNLSPWVSPLARFSVRVRLSVYLTEQMIDSQTVANNCYAELLSQVDLPVWDYERIAPLVYRSGGSLGNLSVNEQPTVRAASNSRIHLDYLEIRVVDDRGNEELYLYGNGDPI